MNIKDINRNDVLTMFLWCKNKFGVSKFQKEFPKIVVDRTNKDVFGCYYCKKNVITIVLKPHKSVVDLCNTIIHEYTHYLQDMNMYDKYYFKYNRNYDNHPYEISANNKAYKYEKELKKAFLSSRGDLASQEILRTLTA